MHQQGHTSVDKGVSTGRGEVLYVTGSARLKAAIQEMSDMCDMLNRAEYVVSVVFVSGR